jgi:hypothetical protein
MKPKFVILILLAVGLSAILLTSAFYIYWNNVLPEPKPNINVKIAYIYIGHPTVNTNSAGFNMTFRDPVQNTTWLRMS